MRLMKIAVIVAGFVILTTPVPARATPMLYEYQQTSSTVPGFTMSVSLLVDGELADIPTVGCVPPYYCSTPFPSFGPLLALSVTVPQSHGHPSVGGVSPTTTVTLADLVKDTWADLNFGRHWTVSAGGLYFLSSYHEWDYYVSFGDATHSARISFNSDGGTSVGGCTVWNQCQGAGYMLASPMLTAHTPEPSTWLLVGMGVVLIAAGGKRRLSREHNR